MASVQGSVSSPRDRGDQGDHVQGQGRSPGHQQEEETASCHAAEAEVFCGRIPKEVNEAELRTLFSSFGEIREIRFPKFPVTGLHKGFAFITFVRHEDAAKAIMKMNGRQVRHRQYLKVTRSVPNTRLFIGNIPKAKGQAELFREFATKAPGLKEVIIYYSPDDGKKNRGFCFLDYETHRAAAAAKRRLSTRDSKIFGCDVMVDWADPEQEVDDATMSKVQILYVRHIPAAVTEGELRLLFEEFGPLDRVKKIKDFAFIHFAERADAAKAKEGLNGFKVRGVALEIQWAKPPTTKEMRQQMLRAREKRILIQHYLKPPRGIIAPFPLPTPTCWDEDFFIPVRRGDRGDQPSTNQRTSTPCPKPQRVASTHMTPEETLDRFREACEPYDHWSMIQHQLPRIPSHVFLLSDDDDSPVRNGGLMNRGRNRFGSGFHSSSREANEIPNWRLNIHHNSPSATSQPFRHNQQRHREWINTNFFNRNRRNSEAETSDNWRARN